MLCHAVQHRRLPEGKEESMFFYYFDRYYWILIVPALLFAIWAQSRVSITYRKYSQVRSARGMTAAQVCRQILDENGLFGLLGVLRCLFVACSTSAASACAEAKHHDDCKQE